jgi:hypothetical protein
MHDRGGFRLGWDPPAAFQERRVWGMDFALMRRLRSLVIVFVLVAAACSGSGAPDVSPTVLGFLDRLGDDVPVSQAVALEDGVVTFEEYEAAFERTVVCLRDSGIVVDGPKPLNGDRFLTFSYQGGIDDGEADGPCRSEHLDLIDTLWNLQSIPTEEELVQIVTDYRDCVVAAGVPVDEGATMEELDRIVGDVGSYELDLAVRPCVERYSQSIFISDA